MIGLVLVALSAGPVSFSAAVRDADRIVVGTAAEVHYGPSPSSVLEVQHALRGPSTPTLRVAAVLAIGQRSLLLLKGERLLAELRLRKEHPGEFVFSPFDVRFDGALRKAVHELPWPSAIPVGDVLRALKVDLAELAPPAAGARVVETTCPPCELEAFLERARLPGSIDCGAVDDGGLDCFDREGATRRRLAVLRAEWGGIDSSGVVALVGSRTHASVYQLDEDVTGGGNLRCTRAIFARQCAAPHLGEPLFGCSGKSAVACSERKSMTERLGPLIPVDSLDAGERFPSDAGLLTCFVLRDGSLHCR